MENIKVVEKRVTAKRFNELRKNVGWNELPEKEVKKAIKNSIYMVIATNEKNDVIGMARLIGDKGLVYYIQDVIVETNYQRNKIGTKMMDKIMEYINKHKIKGLTVGLMAAKGMEKFYSKYGFIERPNNNFGPGMIQFM